MVAQTNRRSAFTWLAALAAAGLLSACGGGGDDSPSGTGGAAITEGAYGGTITGGSASAFQMLVLDSGEVWAMYGVQGASSFAVSGFVQGTINASNGSFTSSGMKDFGTTPATTATVSGTYTSAPAISGNWTAAGVTATFSGGPIAGSTYNYNTAAAVSSVAGAWNLTSIYGDSVALTIQSNGSFSADDGTGCIVSGSLSPRPGGKNVFNVSVTFGAGCNPPGATGSGIAVAYPLNNGQTQLVVGLVESSRTAGTAVFGVR